MIKSQKKAANSYNMKNYILNLPLKRTVINPISYIGGSPILRRPRLPQPLIPEQARQTPQPRRSRLVFRQRQRPTPKPRILSKRPTPAPRKFIPKPIRPDIAQFIEKIKPFYKPEAIAAFKKTLNDKESQINPISKLDKAFGDYALSAEIDILDKREPRNQFNSAYYWIEKLLLDYLNKNRGLKFSLAIKIRFFKLKIDENGEEFREYVEGSFSNIDNPEVLTNSEEIKDKYDFIVETILEKIAKWLSGGSGLIIEEILSNFVNIAKYTPIGGGSYLPTPKEIKNSKFGLINIKNNDDYCVIWDSIRQDNQRDKDPQRITLKDRSYFQHYDLKGINFPCKVTDIKKIEDRIKKNINVFTYDDGVYPLYISEKDNKKY